MEREEKVCSGKDGRRVSVKSPPTNWQSVRGLAQWSAAEPPVTPSGNQEQQAASTLRHWTFSIGWCYNDERCLVFTLSLGTAAGSSLIRFLLCSWWWRKMSEGNTCSYTGKKNTELKTFRVDKLRFSIIYKDIWTYHISVKCNIAENDHLGFLEERERNWKIFQSSKFGWRTSDMDE